MRRVSGFFAHLHFTECNLGPARCVDETLQIPVTGLMTMEGHPLHAEGRTIKGWVVFNGVAGSTRTVVEYIGDPKAPSGFGEPRQESCERFAASGGPGVQKFSFEGYQEQPPAWIDEWVVKAESFELLVED